jgi:hypothetical protein
VVRPAWESHLVQEGLLRLQLLLLAGQTEQLVLEQEQVEQKQVVQEQVEQEQEQVVHLVQEQVMRVGAVLQEVVAALPGVQRVLVQGAILASSTRQLLVIKPCHLKRRKLKSSLESSLDSGLYL